MNRRLLRSGGKDLLDEMLVFAAGSRGVLPPTEEFIDSLLQGVLPRPTDDAVEILTLFRSTAMDETGDSVSTGEKSSANLLRLSSGEDSVMLLTLDPLMTFWLLLQLL